MLLGALVQEMRSAGLSSPDSSEPLQGFSLATTLGLMRNFRTPVIFSPKSENGHVKDKCKNYELDMVWRPQRSLYWTGSEPLSEHLFRHKCSLQALLNPCLQTIESKATGLNVLYFARKLRNGLM